MSKRPTYLYSAHLTRERAEMFLEHYFSCGEVSPAEVAGIKKIGHSWGIYLYDWEAE